MKKKLLPTVITFAVLLLLLVYANFFEVEEILAPGMQKPELILNCQASEITAITWESVDAPEVKVVFNASAATIVLPAEYRCDQKEAEGLTRHFAELRAEMTVTDNVAAASSYGIDNTAPTVLIEAAGKSTRLILGNKTEVGGSYYLAKEGDERIFSVPGYIQPGFFKTLENLRDRNFFAVDFGQVNSVTLTTPQSEIILTMDDSHNEWNIVKPVSLPADGVVVAEILQRMRNLRIAHFVDDLGTAATAYGFDKGPFKMEVRNSDGVAFAFATGNSEGIETYVRTAGKVAVHKALSSELNEINRTVEDLREKFITVPAFADLTEMTVADASASITIENKSGNWMVGVQQIATDDVKSFVNSIGQAKVFAFLLDKHREELGLANKEACRIISIVGKEQKLKLWLGSRQGANVGVMSDSDVMEVNAELDDAFKKFMLRLRRSGQSEVVPVPDHTGGAPLIPQGD